MIMLISLLLTAQGIPDANNSRWGLPDVLIENSLGPYVEFSADYNYTTGDIYIACAPDSGIYFHPDSLGILFFRSTDHGETWDMIGRDVYEAEGWRAKEIDIVATRSDTVFVLFNWYYTDYGYDGLQVGKIYDSGGNWSIEWISPIIEATEIRSPKLVRDDFADFYLYLAYLDITPGNDSLIILRSEDRGYNWSNLLRATSAAEWQDQDITIADSSIYHLSTLQSGNNQTLQFSYWRDTRNSPTSTTKNLISVDTEINGQIYYPRIGATTTLPDTTQLVYAVYSKEDSLSGAFDLLYLYSEEGGNDWPNMPDTLNIPDTLANESSLPVLCNLRGYQAAPNQWMDITYCTTTPNPSFENFWCRTSESEPTNWQDVSSVGTGQNRSIPEIVYSPGASATGAAVVFNDSLGNLWFDAPWRESGITENTAEGKNITRSQIVPAGSIVKIESPVAKVYDLTGREIVKLNTNSWDLKDGNGKKVETGIYFIVEKNGNKRKLSVIK